MQQVVSDGHCEYLGTGGLECDAPRSPERIAGIAGIGLCSKDVGPPAVSSAVVGKEFAVGREAELGIEDDRSWLVTLIFRGEVSGWRMSAAIARTRKRRTVQLRVVVHGSPDANQDPVVLRP